MSNQNCCSQCAKLAAVVGECQMKITRLQKELGVKDERLDELQTFEQGLGFVQKLFGIIIKQKNLN